MVALPLSHTNRNSSRVRQISNWSAFHTFWVAMSRRDDIEELWKREDLSFEGKLDAYLDGYMMSFDMYPVCQRQLFMRNDAYALWRDFMAIGEDMNKAAQKLLKAPDEEFAGAGMGPDDIRRRRIEAAKRTLAAIERARAKPPEKPNRQD
jgi:hypothetical protein